MAIRDKQVSDEQIITALLTTRNRKQAADKAGLSMRQLYERTMTNSFQAQIQAARADMLRETLESLANAQTRAANVLIDIMEDDDAAVSERIQAARIVLDFGAKAAQAIESADRAAAASMRSAGDFDMMLKMPRIIE